DTNVRTGMDSTELARLRRAPAIRDKSLRRLIVRRCRALAPSLLQAIVMRLPVPILFVFAVACSAGSSDTAGPASPPGGGVSFGGAQDIGELRAILDRGEIPGPDTFDANGFFNEHYNVSPP